MIFTAAIALAGCSSAMSEETPNTAVVIQSGPDLSTQLAASPPPPLQEPALDGAPLAPAPVVPPQQALAPQAPPAVAPPAEVRRVQARFTCDIDVKRTSNGIRVTPVVRSDKSLSGEYSLVITKSGSGGSSDISQGGPFDVSRGERVSLSASEFSMERGAKFRAVLKVRADGREICRDISS